MKSKKGVPAKYKRGPVNTLPGRLGLLAVQAALVLSAVWVGMQAVQTFKQSRMHLNQLKARTSAAENPASAEVLAAETQNLQSQADYQVIWQRDLFNTPGPLKTENHRISPELHAPAAIKASAHGKSLNRIVSEAIEKVV